MPKMFLKKTQGNLMDLRFIHNIFLEEFLELKTYQPLKLPAYSRLTNFSGTYNLVAIISQWA